MFTLDIALMKALFFLLAIIAVDVVLGACIALKGGNFSLAELPRFLRTTVLPYYLSIMSLVGLAMVQEAQEYGIKPLAWTVLTVYITKVILVDLKDKIFILFGVTHERTGESASE